MPAWERDGPLVYRGEQLLYVPGLGIDARALAAKGVPPGHVSTGCRTAAERGRIGARRIAAAQHVKSSRLAGRLASPRPTQPATLTMALIVHKYGGTSMGSTERIRNVAKRVAKWARAGHQMVVVPSAMSGETNRLLGLAKELLARASRRRADARTRHDRRHRRAGLGRACWPSRCRPRACTSVSYAGWQVPITTDIGLHQGAHREHRRRARARRPGAGKVVIITGFQGVDAEGNVTTLGRGGSDTSAVAVAAAMKADECLIYTDVDGVYTTDPRIVPEARRLHTISFEEMLEMASLGSKVLQIRSVEFAGKYRVPLRVLSSFTPWDIEIDEEARSGTLITFEEDDKMEQAVVSGIAFNRDEAKVSRARRARQAGHRLPDPGRRWPMPTSTST